MCSGRRAKGWGPADRTVCAEEWPEEADRGPYRAWAEAGLAPEGMGAGKSWAVERGVCICIGICIGPGLFP